MAKISSRSRTLRRSKMKANKRILLVMFGAIMAVGIFVPSSQLPALAAKSSHGTNDSTAVRWSLQVDKVDPGDVDLSRSFQIASYEGLLQEFGKTNQFKQVFRDGDLTANGISDLLILKTKVEKYTVGSETTRAVTTVAGATKLTVRS